MEQKIKVVALYVRKSRDNNESLEGQLSSLMDFCEKYGWEYEIFKEEGSASSEEWNRPELQRMIKLIEAQHFDAVVVTEQTRICRNDDFPKFRDILKETNCYFVITSSNSVYDYNKPEDEFVSDIMTAVGKNEITWTKIRLKRGTIQKAKKGHWMGKKNPIGYKYNRQTKRLEPSEDAPIIRQMFELYRDGLSTKDIAHKFTFENVVTSVGMIWTPAGISRLLNNVVYIGHSLYGKTTQKKDKKTGRRITKETSKEEQIFVKNTHEPIVSQELWDEVQRIKDERNSRPVALKLGKHKFSGLIRCGVCGRVHSFQTSRYKRKRISSCQTRHYNEDNVSYTVCKNKGANITEFEKLFYDQFEAYVDRLEEHIDLIKQSVSKGNTINHEKEIESKERQIKKFNNDIKRVQKGFIMEIFTEEEAQAEIKGYKDRIQTLENEIEMLREQENYSEVDYLETTLNKLRMFLTNKDDMDEHEANEILKEFIETILYYKTEDNMEINIVMKEIA